MSKQPTQPNAEDLREEERLEDALEQLKILHLQLRHLRTTVPRLIEPLANAQLSRIPSPEVLWSSYKQAILTANKEVAEFKAEMTSETSQKIFEETRASRQARPLGIRPWRATEHPDWTTPKKKKQKIS